MWHAPVEAVAAIFGACVRTGHNPEHFRRSVTVVLREGDPRDFRLPKSYRPVALLNTLGKLLESIIATRIAWAVEELNLLPRAHLEGHKGISVDHMIQMILDKVYSAWENSHVASILLLDVSGAYNFVSHVRLIHNVRQSRLGHFAPWIKAFLTGHTTQLKMQY